MLFQNIACFNNVIIKTGKELSRNHEIVKKMRPAEKASLTLPGSLTLEASVVLPLFFVLMSVILFFFQVLLFQVKLQQAMDWAVQKVSAYEYAVKQLEKRREEGAEQERKVLEQADDAGQEILRMGVTAAALRTLLLSKMDGELFERTHIDGGASGLSLLQSKLPDENGILDLVVTYRVKFPFLPGESGRLSFSQRSCRKVWTGSARWKTDSDGDAETEEEMVYITEHGTVYHRDINCSYLHLSIQTVLAGEEGTKRNRYGEKYKPCELCTDGIHSYYVYITDSGNRYHYQLHCSGLTRNIRKVPLSEAEGLRPCGRCGGGAG